MVPSVDHVVDGHHVGVVDTGERPGLAQHSGPEHGRGLRIVFGQPWIRRPDLLERHGPVQDQIARPPHHAHTAATEPRFQLEASVDDPSAGLPVVHGVEPTRCR